MKILDKYENKHFIITILVVFLASCKNGKLPGGDARKFPDDPKLRVKKNLEEGRGFRLNDAMGNMIVVAFLNLLVQMNYGEHL